MEKMLHRTLQFICLKRKQILFALFALICSILDKDTGVLKCAAPAVVAAAATAGSTATGTATGVAVSGNVAGGTISTGTGASTTANAVAETSKTAINTSKNLSNNIKNKNINSNNNVLKNTNPKGTHSNTLSSNSVTNELTKSSVGMNEATDKVANKEASKSDVSKETKASKRSMMNAELNNDDNDEEEVGLENASKEITKGTGSTLVWTLIFLFFVSILFVPVLILTIISPTSSVMSQMDCEVNGGVNCVEEESGNFFNKLKNLFSFGSYGSNSEVVIDKINEVYDRIYEEDGFSINLPLLSSSLFSDSEYVNTKLDENNEPTITDKMLERLEYVEDLARLQMIEDYVIYTCSVKTVDGMNVYYKETNYDNIDPETVSEGDCNNSNVGMILKEKSIQYNEEEYFLKLRDSELLDLVYSDYIESDDLLVLKIRNQYKLYNSLNLINTEDDDYGTIPMTLMYDSSVNLQAPLKGWYSITSPFGNREGVYSGMHTGIDLVANDKNIYAVGNGVVTRSNVETEGGNVVEITHTASDGTEYVSQYAHLSQRLVSVGDVVNSGDIIGIMGDTGTMASGVHLHFSMWMKEPYELLNPKNLFSGASNY